MAAKQTKEEENVMEAASNRMLWMFVIVVVALFLLLVWPGMTTYAVLSASNGQALLKVNRIT